MSQLSSEPAITAQQAVAYLRQHPELVTQAQDIVRSMQASGKSESEIELAVRRFVANKQAAEQKSRPADNNQRERARSGAQEITPYQAEEVRPFQAEEVKPHSAQEVQPSRRAEDVKPYRADNGKPIQREIGPDPRRYPKQGNNTGIPSVFMHTFGLAVPGVAYSYDNYATNTRTTVTAAGTVTKSAVRINADHTFDWNSAWDGRMIHGRWTERDGGIRLIGAQEGKDWLMDVLKPASGKATIVLYTDSVQYHGTPLD